MQQNYAVPFDRFARGGQRYTNARPRLRTVPFNGLPISIEIEVGQTKSGIDENGETWTKTYTVPYGEIPSTVSLADGDGVDIYLCGSNPNALVYVVHQVRADGSFDEDKVLLGASSAGEAKQVYKDHGPVWGFGSMDALTWDQFERGYLASNRKI